MGPDANIRKLDDLSAQVSRGIFSLHSLVILALCLIAAVLIGRLVAHLLRMVVVVISNRADTTEDLRRVNRLRHFETLIVLNIALFRTLLIVAALYLWWLLVHPEGQSGAIIGAGAVVAILLGSSFGPVLRDFAAGAVMMAEQWYGVGDHVRLEPFADMQGVVERVTLRSTRIRGLNGEVIWVNNQHIQGARIAPRGIRTIALEIFVIDLKAGTQLIEKTNRRLPIGPLLVSTPLQILSHEEVGDELWHITAVGETAPGREWLLETSAVELVKSLDEASRKPVIAHGPLARYADSDAERRFKRTIHNARKSPAKRKTRTVGVRSRGK